MSKSKLIVVFLCNNYKEKEWCGLEWRVVKEIIKKKQDESLMFFKFDNVDIEGLFSTDGYIEVLKKKPKQVSDLIIKRLSHNEESIIGFQEANGEENRHRIKNSKKSFEQGLKDYAREIPPTNHAPENSEWRENLYRNTYYNFRVEFPKGWEYDTGASKRTLARCLNREIGATIAVLVSHIGISETPLYPNYIVQSVPLAFYIDDFNKVLALQNIKADQLKTEIGTLNNFPAYIVSFTTLQSSGTQSYIFISRQINCYQNGLLYQIALNIPLDYYNSDTEILHERVESSFTFENAF
jgi:hypothetical protein